MPAIQKVPAGHRQQFKDGSIAAALERQLRNHVSSLLDQFVGKLEKSENELKNHIVGLKDDAYNPCVRLGQAEQLLRSSFADETIQREDEGGKEGKRPETIGERMKYYRSEYKKQGDALQNLWDQWSEIQYEIILLAVEIFGKDIVHLDHQMLPDELPNRVDQAHTRYEAVLRADQEVLAQLSEFEREAKDMGAQYIKDSKEHLQAIKISNGKHFRGIKNTLNEMSDM